MPCVHALFFITSLSGRAREIDQYVHDYYSVARFNATYVDNVPAIESKHQWDFVDPGFVLQPPVQGRAPGRPRKVRIRSSSEGSGLGPRKRKCKRCGGLGHIARICKNAVDPAFGEDEHWGAENTDGPLDPSTTVPSTAASVMKKMKKVKEVAGTSEDQVVAKEKKRKKGKEVAATSEDQDVAKEKKRKKEKEVVARRTKRVIKKKLVLDL